MQRNEQEMLFADPAWQHVSHESMGIADLENPLVLPGNVRSSEWENEEKGLEEGGHASSYEQGYQGQGHHPDSCVKTSGKQLKRDLEPAFPVHKI